MTRHLHSAYAAQAFGLRWHSDHPIPWFADAPDDGRPPDVEIERLEQPVSREGGVPLNRGAVFSDGTRISFEGAVIDMIDGRRIRWFSSGHDEAPLAIGSTAAAHLLAWRGLVPLHGSAVAFGEQAILVCGPSGAGKSTLAYALTKLGGRLVSDDLSAMLPVHGAERPLLVPGRPGVMLADPREANGGGNKRRALPPRVDSDRPVALAMLLLLRESPIGDGPAAAAAAIRAQQFRPRWMAALPGLRERTGSLLHASQRIAIETLPPASLAGAATPAERAGQAFDLLSRHCGAALPRAAPAS